MVLLKSDLRGSIIRPLPQSQSLVSPLGVTKFITIKCLIWSHFVVLTNYEYQLTDHWCFLIWSHFIVTLMINNPFKEVQSPEEWKKKIIEHFSTYFLSFLKDWGADCWGGDGSVLSRPFRPEHWLLTWCQGDKTLISSSPTKRPNKLERLFMVALPVWANTCEQGHTLPERCIL